MVNVQFNSKKPPSECYSSEMAEMVVKFCFSNLEFDGGGFLIMTSYSKPT